MFAKGCWGVDHLINPPLRHCPNYTPSHGNIDCWKNFVIQSWQRSLRWVPQYHKDLSNWQCTLLENCNIVIGIEYLRYGTIIIKKTVIWNADLVDFEVESSKTWNLIMADLVGTNVYTWIWNDYLPCWQHLWRIFSILISISVSRCKFALILLYM